MKTNRKKIREKLQAYLDIQLSLTRLNPQKDRAAYRACINRLSEITRMLNAIPVGSREYNAVRLKYIERKSWVQIEFELHLSERACREAASRGLDMIARRFFSGE